MILDRRFESSPPNKYRGSSVMVAYKAHNLSGGVQVPLPQQISNQVGTEGVLTSSRVTSTGYGES